MEAEDKEEMLETEDLLYDILVYREWPQTQDPRSLSVNDVDSSHLSTNGGSSWFSYLTSWSAAANAAGLVNPPHEVLNLLQASPSWKFCLSNDYALLAVLQENLLEFYSSKDNFANSLAKVRLPRDAQPHLRLIEWSPDSSLLVLTSSSGSVDLYDAYGFLVYSVFSQRLPQNEASNEETGGQNTKGYAYAGAFFSDCRVKSRDWLYELILIDYRGMVNSFLLSPSGYQEFTSYKLTSYYPHGITAVFYSTKHNVLIVAGPVQCANLSDKNGPSTYGLSIWRLLNEAPHYEVVLPHDYVDQKPTMRWLYSKLPDQDYVFKLEESPSGESFCAIHISGNISIWRLPGLRMEKLWHLDEQPCHDDMNPALMQNPRLKRRKKQFLAQSIKWNPLDVKWWNNQSIIIGRFSGGVTILTLTDSDRNLLGESAEFFAGPPFLSKCFGKGFFVLEREISNRRHRPKDEEHEEDAMAAHSSESSEDEEDSEVSLLIRGKRLATSIAYSVTESERFAPPRKRPRINYHSYKLVTLISTTPDELYNRKIEMEEYGEALILAQHYNLDSDQVYERQWRLSTLSTSAISDYLMKVKRRSLVLRECLNTVPNDVDAIRALLEYGLKETDLGILDMMSCDENEGRFIKSSRPSNAGHSNDYYLTDEELLERKAHEEQRLISRIDWDNLSIGQRELLAQRYTLVKYLDRLDCYLEVVDRYQRYSKDVYFDKEFYVKFRNMPILEATIEFAHQGKSRAVSVLFDRYHQELEKFRLTILSNFPESLSPDDYSDMIPSVQDLLSDPHQGSDPDESQDWIEYEFIKAKVPDHVKQECHVEKMPFIRYKTQHLTRDSLTKWIHERARHIEMESSLVDHALGLLQYASEYCGVTIDLRLHHQLTTLEAMFYDMENPNALSLCQMENMSDLEILLKMMENSSKESVINDVRRFMVPYLDRLEQLESGSRASLLQNYLLNCATTSLELPFEIIKNTQAQQTSVFMSFDECVNIGLDCIYAHESTDDEHDESETIVELANFLKKRCKNPHVLVEIEDILDIMRSIKLLKKYSIQKSLHYFKACRNDKKAMEDLFVQVARRAEGKKPRFTAREWSEVLTDLFELRRLLPVVNLFTCVEILCESLLCSEADENIELVHDILNYKPADALFKKTKSAMLYAMSVYKIGTVPPESKEKIVITAFEYYLDSSKDLDDPNLELAKRCLDLVKDETSISLQKHYDLLMALQLLHEFGLSILPIVLRNTTNYMPIVSKILQIDPAAYKKARKILRAIKLIANEKSLLLDEAPLLNLIAEYALKSKDYDYCMTICDLMMEQPSKEACNVCLNLVNAEEFADLGAKSRLASFCVNFCDDSDIEDMLLTRINLSDEMPLEISLPPPSQLQPQKLDEPQMSDALAKLTTSQSPVVNMNMLQPVEAGTKVLSSLFGKLSKFNPILHGPATEEMDNIDADKNERIISPRKKTKTIAVNVFYEDSYPQSRIGQLHANLETYASACNSGPVDWTTLCLLSRHYRNCFEYDEEDRIEWSVLKDILYILVEEDTGLGVTLLLTELSQHPEIIADFINSDLAAKKRLPLGLYLAALHAGQQKFAAASNFAPGALYCACKALLDSGKLGDNPIFAKAVELSNCDDDDDDDAE